MCRAVWAMVVGADEEACGRLRRGAGADVEVVAAVTSRDEALAKLGDAKVDVAVIDGAMPGAGALGETLREAGLAVVVVGPRADVEPGPSLPVELPGAITRALMARRRPPGA